MSEKYYRGLRNILNDTKHKLQLVSMTLKINENKNNITGIKNDISKINNFSDKINDNETNISDNKGLIETNVSNISDNLEQINDIKSLLPTSEIFKKTYGITNQSFKFTKNIIYFKLLETEIENSFNKDGKLEFDSDIYYKYDNLQRDHHRLQHEYRILDDNNNLLFKKILNKTNTSDLNFDNNIMLVKDNFYVTFKNNYNKIKIILDLYRVYRHGTGNFNLELINESFTNVTYLDKNYISLKIDTNKNDILTNLSKINTNVADISSNLSQISTNTGSISSNSRQINTNKGNISSNLGKINNITKTFMLKNIYFTDFDSRDKAFVKELLHLDNTLDKLRTGDIYNLDMEYNFKKDDFIEIDCKLLISHSSYDNARNNIVIYYDLYDEKVDDNNLIFRESHRYYEFPLITNKNRIIVYTKICYKVKYDINKIKFLVLINSTTRKTHLILYHYIIQKGVNYISVKHYGKS